MSKQVTLNGFVYYRKPQYSGQKEFEYIDFDIPDSCLAGRVKVMPHSFTVEIPDDFDPIPGKVAAIKKQQLELKAEFAKKMMELDSDLANLLCIESVVQS